MSNAYASVDLHVSADQVWQLIGGFDSLPDWLPYIPKSALSEGGRIRTLQSIEGKTIIERLLAFSESERSYTYTILQGPAPVRDYQATLRVLANGHGSKVEWFGSFTPDGISEAEAEAMFEEIYKGGLAALKQTLEG
ncbi:SRPBCC family protein [Pseudomonas sp. JS3066]|uniref:SRPBCC family protein n=1 Tax=Pseudomonas sp. JS3066 TaxID=3090665 RepID=UPI002E7BD4C7|nr:SRPBCC family protein [Pseudomonas sp. JS3066]WVK95662.1 SRPBCC family protein [Pseudomonas sp. JS3066]